MDGLEAEPRGVYGIAVSVSAHEKPEKDNAETLRTRRSAEYEADCARHTVRVELRARAGVGYSFCT